MGRPARVTRTQVLKAAREAFAAGGYDGTTLATIAARLGLSPAALLRHAPSKAALFAAAMAEPPAAMAFIGNLNAYVFFHRVVPLVDPPLPLDRYIDTLLDIWSRGALAAPRKRAS